VIRVMILLLGLTNMSHVQEYFTLIDYLETLDPYFEDPVMSEDRIEQYYFTDVSFWEIDTFSVDVDGHFTITPSPWSPHRPLRLAVDRHAAVYRIRGFDTCEYNNMIDANPTHIDNYTVYNYGRFYLDLQREYDIGFYNYITNIDDFIALSRSIMTDSITCNHPDKQWEKEETILRSLLAEAHLGRIEFLAAENKFMVDYYVWLQNTGDLIHHVLEISATGLCTVVVSEKLADKVGYWTNTH